ncbi:MAG: methyltransferase domain-containing protein [Helicobacteraceae bacterium]|nr:methyltransferase domain-containing protein [Helicobacteraceae bacterium]
MNSVFRHFNDRAHGYAELNGLQRSVARELIAHIPFKPRRILDIGCGNGMVHSLIDWEYDLFIAADFAPKMCELHPKNEKTTVVQIDFNVPEQVSKLGEYAPFDLIVSSSALQWAGDLDRTLEAVCALGRQAAFAIFTDGTFKELRKGKRGVLRSFEEVKGMVLRVFNARIWRGEFTLTFDSRQDLFGYIRKCGIGGGVKTFSFKEARETINSYPDLYLKCEVLFAVSQDAARL